MLFYLCLLFGWSHPPPCLNSVYLWWHLHVYLQLRSSTWAPAAYLHASWTSPWYLRITMAKAKCLTLLSPYPNWLSFPLPWLRETPQNTHLFESSIWRSALLLPFHITKSCWLSLKYLPSFLPLLHPHCHHAGPSHHPQVNLCTSLHFSLPSPLSIGWLACSWEM